MRIGLGNSIGLWAEWWAGEFQVLLAGLFCGVVGDCEEVAATVLIRNIGSASAISTDHVRLHRSDDACTNK